MARSNSGKPSRMPPGARCGKKRPWSSVASGADLVSRLPNGDQVHNVSVVFTVEDWEGLPTPDGKETLEARFFHASALPHDLNPPDRAILARFGQGG